MLPTRFNIETYVREILTELVPVELCGSRERTFKKVENLLFYLRMLDKNKARGKLSELSKPHLVVFHVYESMQQSSRLLTETGVYTLNRIAEITGYIC